MRMTPIQRAFASAATATLVALGACSDDDKPVSDATTSDTAIGADTAEPPSSTQLVKLLDGESIALVFGKSQAVSFTVPDNTVSVSIAVVGEPGNSYVIEGWQDDSSTTLVPENWLATSEGGGLCLQCTNRVNMNDAAFASLAPNNPSAVLNAGAHSFTVLGASPKPVTFEGSADCGDGICHLFDQLQGCTEDCGATPSSGFVAVTVIAKVAVNGALPETGVLDLNLHFTGAEGLSAESAQTDAAFQASLEMVRTLYRQVGIDLGNITYHDVESRFAVIETFDGPDSDLIEMFEMSAGNPEGLNLFFVSELSSAQFGGAGVILGISGGIPGPPLEQGTPRSGVAVAIKPVQGAPAGIDTTIAHEMGHFLGLFHTSEQNFFGGPGIHDPIPDTPDNDETYLMFNTGAGSNISPQQGVVMRANPFVRHPVAAAAN